MKSILSVLLFLSAIQIFGQNNPNKILDKLEKDNYNLRH